MYGIRLVIVPLPAGSGDRERSKTLGEIYKLSSLYNITMSVDCILWHNYNNIILPSGWVSWNVKSGKYWTVRY